MSDDLISRKFLLECAEYDDKGRLVIPYRKVENAPTAFDKEKVIEKIKCERDEAQDYNQYSAVAAHEIDIDIVGKGGTE